MVDAVMRFAPKLLILGVAAAACGLLPGCQSGHDSPRSSAAHSTKAAERAVARAQFDSGKSAATFDEAWRIIYETHFDTNFNGVDWLALKTELRPKAEAATSIDELRRLLDDMLDRLGQSHMKIIPADVAKTVSSRKTEPSDSAASNADASAGSAGSAKPHVEDEPDELDEGDGDLGFDVRLIRNQLVVSSVEPDGPAAAAGVRPGWILHAIGSRSISNRLDRLTTGVDDKRLDALSWAMARGLMRGATGSSVEVEFLDAHDKPVRVEMTRTTHPGEPVKFGHLPKLFARLQSKRVETPAGGAAGVIAFNMWMLPVGTAFDKAIDEFRTTDGIVLDLRGNVGGMAGLVMGIAGHFFRERVTLGYMKMRGSELKLFANPRFSSPAGRRVEPFGGPVAILVDGVSISASELFAGGMQDAGRVKVFGQTTAGQALPAMMDALPNGDVLYHAIADFVSGSGTRLEGRGVIPDVHVPLHREDLLVGRDAALEAALAWIDSARRTAKLSTTDRPWAIYREID